MNTKVVPVNYTDELKKKNVSSKDNCLYIGIEEIKVTYIQPADTNSAFDRDQLLTITTKTAKHADFNSIEKQDGFYCNISIPEGEHWSVESGDELKALVDDFKKRVYITTDDSKKVK